MDAPLRLAHVVSHPVPYLVPLYRELALRPEVDLTVYFCSDASLRAYRDQGFDGQVWWDLPLLDGYRSCLPPSARGAAIAARRVNWDICRALRTQRYHAVWLHGYGYPTAWAAALAARLAGSAVLLREEQTLLHPRPPHKRLAKRVLLRWLFGLAWGLYIGEQNRRYLRHYGMPEGRMFPARYCVDNDALQASAARLRPERARIRRELGIGDGAPVILFCGKLIPKKQPLLLLEAYRRVRRELPCWLLLAGDGPLRERVELAVRRDRIPGVLLPGFMGPAAIPAAYSAADLLALPSRLHETWGVVVNEAMNFGLPVVVSDKVGCAEDLVRPGWNGLVVPYGSAGELAGALRELVCDPGRRALLGRRGRELVDSYSVARCADGIVSACLAAVHRRQGVRRPGEPLA